MFNWGKLIVLVFCFITVIPMLFLVIGAIAFQSGYNGSVFKNTTLGNLTNLWDN